jgi:hypothetical protein
MRNFCMIFSLSLVVSACTQFRPQPFSHGMAKAQSIAPGAPVPAPFLQLSDAQCVQLDDSRKTWGGIDKAMVGLTGGSGIASLATLIGPERKNAALGLAIVTIVLAAGAEAIGWLSDQQAAEYVTLCTTRIPGQVQAQTFLAPNPVHLVVESPKMLYRSSRVPAGQPLDLGLSITNPASSDPTK